MMTSPDIDNAFKDKLLSVVIPAYNEEKRIGTTVKQVLEYLRGKGWKYEVIVVDDGSADRTADMTREAAGGDPSVLLISNGRNMGKGFTVRRGMMAAHGDARLFTDADAAAPIEDMEKLIPHWQAGCGVVFGSRNVPGSRIEIHQSRLREGIGRIFNLLVRLLVLPGCKDTQAGFKLFSRECAEKVFPKQRLTNFAFDVEILFLARCAGFKIAEVPITWSDRSGSKIRIFLSPTIMLLELLKIRWNQLCGRYSRAGGATADSSK